MNGFEWMALLDQVAEVFQQNEAVFEMNTVVSAEDDLKNRIFYEGKNAFNSQIGQYGKYYSHKYKDYWVPLREDRGLQTEYVDLKFTGDLM